MIDFLPNGRYIVASTHINTLGGVTWISQSEIWGQSWPKIAILGKNREIGKNWEIFERYEKIQYNDVLIIKIHILAKFHKKIMIFGEISGHLVILPIYRAQTRDS